MDEVGQKPAIWKHIGLYGHAVGTFTGKKNNNIGCLRVVYVAFFANLFFVHMTCVNLSLGNILTTTRSLPALQIIYNKYNICKRLLLQNSQRSRSNMEISRGYQ
jgi:hypothetical protein